MGDENLERGDDVGKSGLGDLLILEAFDVLLVRADIVHEDNEVLLGVRALVVDLGLLGSALHLDCELIGGWLGVVRCEMLVGGQLDG